MYVLTKKNNKYVFLSHFPEFPYYRYNVDGLIIAGY